MLVHAHLLQQVLRISELVAHLLQTLAGLLLLLLLLCYFRLSVEVVSTSNRLVFSISSTGGPTCSCRTYHLEWRLHHHAGGAACTSHGVGVLLAHGLLGHGLVVGDCLLEGALHALLRRHIMLLLDGWHILRVHCLLRHHLLP